MPPGFTGVGVWYEWTGNDQVRHGKMAVKSIADNEVSWAIEQNPRRGSRS